jgi:zinc protease
MDMLTRAQNANSLQISEQLQMLGSSLDTGAQLDICAVNLNTLKEKLDPSLELLSDVVLNPSFPEQEFKRLQQQTLARIQREKVMPVAMALRVFPAVVRPRPRLRLPLMAGH